MAATDRDRPTCIWVKRGVGVVGDRGREGWVGGMVGVGKGLGGGGGLRERDRV